MKTFYEINDWVEGYVYEEMDAIINSGIRLVFLDEMENEESADEWKGELEDETEEKGEDEPTVADIRRIFQQAICKGMMEFGLPELYIRRACYSTRFDEEFDFCDAEDMLMGSREKNDVEAEERYCAELKKWYYFCAKERKQLSGYDRELQLLNCPEERPVSPYTVQGMEHIYGEIEEHLWEVDTFFQETENYIINASWDTKLSLWEDCSQATGRLWAWEHEAEKELYKNRILLTDDLFHDLEYMITKVLFQADILASHLMDYMTEWTEKRNIVLEEQGDNLVLEEVQQNASWITNADGLEVWSRHKEAYESVKRDIRFYANVWLKAFIIGDE